VSRRWVFNNPPSGAAKKRALQVRPAALKWQSDVSFALAEEMRWNARTRRLFHWFSLRWCRVDIRSDASQDSA
jgi:hypothetical protein